MIHKLALALGALMLAAQPASADTVLYVSLMGEKRIETYRLDEDTGELTPLSAIETEGGPGSLGVDPQRKFLFAAIRSAGRLASYAIDPENGALRPINFTEPGDAAYVAADRSGRYLLAAYYRAGKLTVHAIDEQGRLGAEPLQSLDTAEKAHSIIADRSNRFVFAPHIGPNAVFQYRFDSQTGRLEPNDPPRVERGEGTGPRHIAEHPTQPWVYVDNEQGSSVTAYKLDRQRGTLEPFDTVSTLPEGYDKPNSNADVEVHPSGRFVYASNRGHDSIACFSVDQSTGKLTSLGQEPTEKTPREFAITPSGKFLIAAGEASGKLAVYRIDQETGRLERLATYEVGKQPFWVTAIELPAR